MLSRRPFKKKKSDHASTVGNMNKIVGDECVDGDGAASSNNIHHLLSSDIYHLLSPFVHDEDGEDAMEDKEDQSTSRRPPSPPPGMMLRLVFCLQEAASQNC